MSWALGLGGPSILHARVMTAMQSLMHLQADGWVIGRVRWRGDASASLEAGLQCHCVAVGRRAIVGCPRPLRRRRRVVDDDGLVDEVVVALVEDVLELVLVLLLEEVLVDILAGAP